MLSMVTARGLLGALVMAATVLAGCSGGSDTDPEEIDRSSFEFESGQGAIAGLLVDDRFRPIQLVEGEPETEFQARGFVLLQETGEQVRTNENGEFTFVELDPGTYTLRVQATGHEATPQRAQVASGAFSELSVVARRIVNLEGAILTQDYSMFIACAADYVANGGNLPCDLDLSSDGYSSFFNSNYTAFGEDANWLITEMKANQQKRWEVQIRGGCDGRYVAAILTGDYIRIPVQRGVEATDFHNNPGYQYGLWENGCAFQTIMFIDHDYREHHQAILGGTFCCGVGFSAGVKATFLQSLFLGEPEIDIASYCVLC